MVKKQNKDPPTKIALYKSRSREPSAVLVEAEAIVVIQKTHSRSV